MSDSDLNKKARFLTTGQVAERCGVNFRTVIRWIQKGYLKAHRLPGARADHRIATEEFERFLSAQDWNASPTKEDAKNIPVVLVVEDDLQVSRSLERTLTRQGFKTWVANDGFSAGALLNQHRPQLMTLDLRMKGIDGISVLKSVRMNPDLANLKILVVSGDRPEKLEQALKAGADRILAKPFRGQDLIQSVLELLGKENPHGKPKHSRR